MYHMILPRSKSTHLNFLSNVYLIFHLKATHDNYYIWHQQTHYNKPYSMHTHMFYSTLQHEMKK